MSADYTVPLVDLTPWFDGSDRAAVVLAVDEALTSVGFFLVTAHGVDLTLLQREPGSSALDVLLADGTWVHAPAIDDAITMPVFDVP